MSSSKTNLKELHSEQSVPECSGIRKTPRCRLLIVSQVFHPSHDAISQLLDDLAKKLSASDIDVHVLTSAVNYMTCEVLPHYENHKGIRIWRLPGVPLERQNSFARIAAHGLFWGLSGPALLAIPKPDVIMYLSTPPFLGWSAKLQKFLRGTKTMYVAQDVYPEVPVRMGYVKNTVLASALTRLDKSILTGMDRVVVLGEKMFETMVSKNVPSEKIRIIHNWPVNTDIGTKSRKDNPLLRELGLYENFVVQYSGNMGIVHDTDVILDAAAFSQKYDPSIKFLFIGGGKRRQELELRKEAEQLKNVVFTPYQPIENLPTSLAAADVALVSLRPDMEGLVVPSKVYGILAAGVPVVFIGDPDGEVARIIDRAQCGYTVQNGKQLVSCLKDLKNDDALRSELGQRARQYFSKHFSQEKSIGQYRELIEELAQR